MSSSILITRLGVEKFSKMKEFRQGLLLFIVCSCWSLSLHPQNCDYDISTKPDAPVNTQMSTLYPTRDNQFLNSFDFGEIQVQTLKPISLNPSAGWSVPNWTNPPIFQMRNPFEDGGTAGGGYLQTPSNIFQRDFHWEDGWELLWLNTGYYPNGDPIEVANPNGIVPFPFTVDNGSVPYMIYYNRYSAKIRLFAGLFTEFGAFQSAAVALRFTPSDEEDGNINGILRHLSSYDTPLDQMTSVKGQSGVNTLSADTTTSVNNIKVWYTYDFNMAYDPCVCSQTTDLVFELEAVSSSTVNLYGRMITLQESLTDAAGTPIYDDGFLSVQDVNEGLEDGYIMRDRLASLVDDYNTSLDTYEDALDDQRFGQIAWMQDILGSAASLAIDGFVGVLPTGEVSQFLVDGRLTLGADSSDVESFINKGATALLGQGYDFLSSTIFGNNADPVRPSIPTASFSEMRFSGDITESNLVPLTGFYTPGNSIDSANLTPFNYPAYNNPVGLYATLKTPRPDVLINETVLSEDSLGFTAVADSSEYFANPQFPPVYLHYDTTVFKSKTLEHSVYFRLTDKFEYALNQAVDFDLVETQVYLSCQVTLENGSDWTSNDVSLIDSVKNEYSENTNLWSLHDIKNIDSPWTKNIQRQIELTSGWYEIEDITNLLFGTSFESTTYYKEEYESDIYVGPTGWPNTWEDDFDSFIPNTSTGVIKFKPVKIELKILADMNFEQLSSTGEQINTTQVFTYLIYDSDSGVNSLGNDGEFVSASELSNFVEMFPGDLTIESNILHPNAPEIQMSNFGVDSLSVVADRIIVNDSLVGLTDSNGDGELYNLRAFTEIKLDTGAYLGPNLHLEINRDIYGGATSLPATESELLTFCDPDSNYYQGNIDAAAISTDPQNQGQASEPLSSQTKFERGSVSLYPNPARDILAISSSHLDMMAITIYDLSGRPIKQQNLPDQTRQYQMSLSGIAPGTYIVRIDCGDEVFSEKLVVTR